MSELTDYANRGLDRPKINPVVQNQIDLLTRRAKDAPGLLASGIEPQAGFLSNDTAMRREAALGGEDRSVDVLNAIGALNQRKASDFATQARRNIALNAPATQTQQLLKAGRGLESLGGMVSRDYGIEKQQQLNQQRVRIFEQQQEQSLIAGILGVVGTVAGFAIGGPIGAAVGGGVGRAAGGR